MSGAATTEGRAGRFSRRSADLEGLPIALARHGAGLVGGEDAAVIDAEDGAAGATAAATSKDAAWTSVIDELTRRGAASWPRTPSAIGSFLVALTPFAGG